MHNLCYVDTCHIVWIITYNKTINNSYYTLFFLNGQLSFYCTQIFFNFNFSNCDIEIIFLQDLCFQTFLSFSEKKGTILIETDSTFFSKFVLKR